MDLAQPLFPPPPGRMWHLHRNVVVYQGDGTIDDCFLPEGNDTDGIFHSNNHGRTLRTKTSNFGVDGAPDASMYELGRWIFASFAIYDDGDLIAVMAIEPGLSATSPVLNILAQDVQRYYASPPALWPETLEYVCTTHSHDVVAGSIGCQILQWVGDVWVAEPACDSYLCLLGDVPDDGGGDCPPPCENATTGALNALKDQLAESITVGWARKEGRIDPTMFALGQTGELTWPEQWDGAKRLVLDGVNYTATALDRGGFTETAEYLWIKPAFTDAAGNPLFFHTNVHMSNDTEHRTVPS